MIPGEQHAAAAPAGRRVAPWNDERLRAIGLQAITLVLVLALLAYLAVNAVDNLRRQGIATGFDFLGREASFAITTALIPYSPADTYARALLVGLLNTLLVAALGILFATLLGVALGLARLSTNWLLNRLALVYVEIMRNTPLILQLFLWWDLLRLSTPPPHQAWEPLPGLYISLRGVFFPVPVYDPLYAWMGVALVLGIAAALWLRSWARRRQARTGISRAGGLARSRSPAAVAGDRLPRRRRAASPRHPTSHALRFQRRPQHHAGIRGAAGRARRSIPRPSSARSCAAAFSR